MVDDLEHQQQGRRIIHDQLRNGDPRRSAESFLRPFALTLHVVQQVTPSLVAAILEFHRKVQNTGYTARKTIGMLQQAVGDPCQLVLAVVDGASQETVVAYCWLSLQEDVAFLNQVWSRHREATKLLHEAAESWAKSLGATAIRGWAHRPWLLAAEKQWGFRPVAVVMEKPLEYKELKLKDSDLSE